MMVSRRQFFSQFARALADRVVPDMSVEMEDSRSSQSNESPPLLRWLRLPGALPEAEFLKACTRCTDCQEACPHLAIRRLGPEFGDKAGTPAVIVDETPCYLCEGMPCIPACEVGALLPTAVTDVRMGTARLDLKKCYLSDGQPCDYCVRRCPLQDVAISFNGARLPVIHDEGCVGCGVCSYLCPADAITIVSQEP